MIRMCSACGERAEKDEERHLDALSNFWYSMHKPGCPWAALSQEGKFQYFVENGSPLSSVLEDS